jgi:hypothetical protein
LVKRNTESDNEPECRLCSQFQTYRCIARSDETGYERHFATQKSSEHFSLSAGLNSRAYSSATKHHHSRVKVDTTFDRNDGEAELRKLWGPAFSGMTV